MHQSIEYKKIEGFDYEVNIEGVVRRIYKCGTHKILRPVLSHGYQRVALYRGGCEHKKLVHRLIADNFIPNPDNKPHIDHINRIRTDNRISNLRWVTPSENAFNKTCKRTPTIYKYTEKVDVYRYEYYRIQYYDDNGKKRQTKRFKTREEAETFMTENFMS